MVTACAQNRWVGVSSRNARTRAPPRENLQRPGYLHGRGVRRRSRTAVSRNPGASRVRPSYHRECGPARRESVQSISPVKPIGNPE